VATEKIGRVRTCKLGPRRLEDEPAWMERYRQLWDERFDELEKVCRGNELEGELQWTQKVRVSPPP
jgi:hypothetical protein